MSKFRVGQRVRKVCGKRGIGATGTVLAFVEASAAYPDFTMLVRCDESWPCANESIRPASAPAHCDPAHWEPATDSYDVVSWDACVWKPEHLRVGV